MLIFAKAIGTTGIDPSEHRVLTIVSCHSVRKSQQGTSSQLLYRPARRPARRPANLPAFVYFLSILRQSRRVSDPIKLVRAQHLAISSRLLYINVSTTLTNAKVSHYHSSYYLSLHLSRFLSSFFLCFLLSFFDLSFHPSFHLSFHFSFYTSSYFSSYSFASLLYYFTNSGNGGNTKLRGAKIQGYNAMDPAV